MAEDKVEKGKALAALRLRMLDYEGNTQYQQWKASWLLPALSETSFKQVIEVIEECGLSPIVREMTCLFLPKRCLRQEIGYLLRRHKESRRPISPFTRIQQLEEANKALTAQLQAIKGIS